MGFIVTAANARSACAFWAAAAASSFLVSAFDGMVL